MEKKSAIIGLSSLGLSLGEAKVYTTLVISGMLEATPLATKAEVTQSKVYSYLSSLENKGIVSKTQIYGKPNLYVALAYEQVIDHLQSELSGKVSEMKTYFETVESADNPNIPPEFIRVMQGGLAVKNGLAEIINSVEKNVLVVPNDHYTDYVNRLLSKRDEQGKIEIIYHNDPFERVLEFLGKPNHEIVHNLKVLIKSVRPYLIFTDINFEKKSPTSASLILPPAYGMDEILFHFRHPTVVNFQFGMIAMMLDLLKLN